MSSSPPVDPTTGTEIKATDDVVGVADARLPVELQADLPAQIKSRSPWEIVWLKLKRNRAAMFALYVLLFMYGCVFIAGFLAPYGYVHANTDLGFHDPMIFKIHLRDDAGNWQRPFVYGTRVVNPARKLYEEDKSKIYPIRFFVTSPSRDDSYDLLWVIPSNVHLFGVDEPGRIFLFGTDLFGRDTFSRILYGSQISLSVGILGILISTVIGMLVGGISGYFGGTTDFLLMRLVELILAIPNLYLILILRQSFGANLTSTQIYTLIVGILAFIGWATQARVIRGMVLALKEREYVVAAEALGFSKMWIIIKHILPNTFSFVIVTATLSVPFFIIGEVGLSFLGVGIQEPEASWGNMLNAGLNVRYLQDFWWILTPGFFIFVAVLAWNVFGDGLRDATDPRTQR
jgi:peptide/nickel transport system permease protein